MAGADGRIIIYLLQFLNMKLLFSMFLALISSFAGAVFVMTNLNPEVKFWNSLDEMRDLELVRKSSTHYESNAIIFTGGSSCAFGIIPEIVENHTGMLSMNYGLAAGSGAKYIISNAIEKCRPNDILILMLEPHFLVEENRSKPTQLGLALAFSSGNPQSAAGKSVFGDGINPLDAANQMRPGARYTATWIGKLARGRLDYRYSLEDIRPGGWIETEFRETKVESIQSFPAKLTEDAKLMLNKAKDHCEKKSIRIAYAMPWQFASSEHINLRRMHNTRILHELSKIMPVIEDDESGAISEKEYFSDTGNHLNAIGAKIRTEKISLRLRNHIGMTNRTK